MFVTFIAFRCYYLPLYFPQVKFCTSNIITVKPV